MLSRTAESHERSDDCLAAGILDAGGAQDVVGIARGRTSRPPRATDARSSDALTEAEQLERTGAVQQRPPRRRLRAMALIHTCYRITDIDRSVAFYNALGFEEIGRLPIRDEAINVFMNQPGDGDMPRLELPTTSASTRTRSGPLPNWTYTIQRRPQMEDASL